MGNYVFSTEALISTVSADAADETSKHDLGGNIIPALVAQSDAQVYDFSTNEVPGATERDRGYWRDVGTLDAYYDAHMDLISVHPIFNMYNHDWPIHTWPEITQPAKFIFDEDGRRGQALDSMVCAGVVISGGTVRRSILSPLAHLHSYSLVEDSILMHGVEVARSAVVRRAIVDKNVLHRRGRRDRRRPGGRPRALPRLRGRHRRHPQGHAGRRHEGRADDPRVPAGGLRRGGRARRVPRARAARVRGRHRARWGVPGDVATAHQPWTRWPATRPSWRRCARSRST